MCATIFLKIKKQQRFSVSPLVALRPQPSLDSHAVSNFSLCFSFSHAPNPAIAPFLAASFVPSPSCPLPSRLSTCPLSSTVTARSLLSLVNSRSFQPPRPWKEPGRGSFSIEPALTLLRRFSFFFFFVLLLDGIRNQVSLVKMDLTLPSF